MVPSERHHGEPLVVRTGSFRAHDTAAGSPATGCAASEFSWFTLNSSSKMQGQRPNLQPDLLLPHTREIFTH
jgi:hypothetical protein